MAYSGRPLWIEEVAEVVAIDMDHARVNIENQLPEPRDVLAICSSLVTTATVTFKSDKESYKIEELRLAHFSVKEYLISNRVQTGLAFQYDIQECAEDRIAQTCLVYLLQFQGSMSLTSNNNTDRTSTAVLRTS